MSTYNTAELNTRVLADLWRQYHELKLQLMEVEHQIAISAQKQDGENEDTFFGEHKLLERELAYIMQRIDLVMNPDSSLTS